MVQSRSDMKWSSFRMNPDFECPVFGSWLYSDTNCKMSSKKLVFVSDFQLLDISSFVFTTEGHLLPLSLARLSNRTAVPVS